MKLLRLSLPLLVTTLVSAAPAYAAPIAFSLSGPSAVNVDTNPGTEVDLVSAISGNILDLNVFVSITGGHMEDFDLYLTAPDGTTVQFRGDFTNPFIHIDAPFQATFDDEAAALHGAQSGGAIGTFQPFEPLSAFDGSNLFGTWTLRIHDAFTPNEGNDLIEWSISGTIEQAPEPSAILLLGTGIAGLLARRRRQDAA